MHTLFLSAGATLGFVLFAGAAHAEEKPDAVRAAALFEEGRRLMAAEDYAAACPKLAESQALDPLPDTAFDLGICYQKASQAAFKVAHDLSRAPEQTAVVASATPHPSQSDRDDASGLGQTQRVVGLTIGGAGVAGIVAGVITGLMARAAYNQATASCQVASNVCFSSGASQMNSAHNLATASTISVLTGAAAVGAGAIVFFVAPRSKPGEGTKVGLAVAPSAQGASLSVAGRF
jgi:hypothetical protein